MDILWQRIVVFGVLMSISSGSPAWNVGSKGRVNGPTVHSTYFLTPNNAPFPVHASAKVGSLINGACEFSAMYDLGSEIVRTGDFFHIDAFQLKAVTGGGYSCMTIHYYSKQLVTETFQLMFDGINYNQSYPLSAEVTIL